MNVINVGEKLYLGAMEIKAGVIHHIYFGVGDVP